MVVAVRLVKVYVGVDTVPLTTPSNDTSQLLAFPFGLHVTVTSSVPQAVIFRSFTAGQLSILLRVMSST